MFVLPNPVTSWSAERVAAEDNRQALFVGRMEKTKGIDLAAEACRRASPQWAMVRCWTNCGSNTRSMCSTDADRRT